MFKVGDKVIVNGIESELDFNNEIGIVNKVGHSVIYKNYVAIEFISLKNHKLHSCDGVCRASKGFWVSTLSGIIRRFKPKEVKIKGEIYI